MCARAGSSKGTNDGGAATLSIYRQVDDAFIDLANLGVLQHPQQHPVLTPLHSMQQHSTFMWLFPVNDESATLSIFNLDLHLRHDLRTNNLGYCGVSMYACCNCVCFGMPT